MEFQIKQATLDDIDEIRNLNKQLFEHDFPYDNALNISWPLSQYGESYFVKAISDENYLTLIALENSKIVGYLVGSIWEKWTSRPIKTAEIDNMLVLEEYRGNGVGNKLINSFKEWCINREVKDLLVMAYSENTDALKFYKKNGFTELSVRLHQNL